MHKQKTSVSLNILKIKAKYLLSFIVSLLSFINNAQNIDSLKLELKKPVNDTTKLNTLFILIESIEDEEVWTLYNDTGLTLAEK